MPQHEDDMTPDDMRFTAAGRTGRPRFPRPVVILVVEDEALVSMNVCEFLVDQEFTVFAAQDVEEALDLLRQLGGGVDLIFTDVNMPGERNGFDLAREVSICWPAVHIVITSGGWSQTALPADLHRFGPIMSKPYGLNSLASRIIDAIFPPSEPVNLSAT
jgi:DNA-binding response OmpR family regulator